MNSVAGFILPLIMGICIYAIGYTACEIRWCKTMKQVCEWWGSRINISSIDYNDGVRDVMNKIEELRYQKEG